MLNYYQKRDKSCHANQTSLVISLQPATALQGRRFTERKGEAVGRTGIGIYTSIFADVIGESIFEHVVLLGDGLDLLLQGIGIELLLFQDVILHLSILELSVQLVDDAGRFQRERSECLGIAARGQDLFLQFAYHILQFADLPVFLVDRLVHLAASGLPLGQQPIHLLQLQILITNLFLQFSAFLLPFLYETQQFVIFLLQLLILTRQLQVAFFQRIPFLQTKRRFARLALGLILGERILMVDALSMPLELPQRIVIGFGIMIFLRILPGNGERYGIFLSIHPGERDVPDSQGLRIRPRSPLSLAGGLRGHFASYDQRMPVNSAAERRIGGVGAGKIDQTLVCTKFLFHSSWKALEIIIYPERAPRTFPFSTAKLAPGALVSYLSDQGLVRGYYLATTVMQANFKLFLGNQRTSQAEPARIKAKNAKSFRMRTHNLTEQTKELSARPYNYLSCEIPDQMGPNRPPGRELFDKIGMDPLFPEKEFVLDEKRSRNGCEVEHNHFKASFSNRQPLRFLKPELRYRSDSQSVVGRKNELYRQINNPKVLQQVNCKASLIQQSTEFNDSREKQPSALKKEQRSKSGRVSLNVLRSKLKQHFRH